MWGAFAANGVEKLHFINGIMDKFIYKDILMGPMLDSANNLFRGSDWILQEDNDPKHTAKVNIAWRQDNGINRMEWPAQSPDLNPIENLWHILNQKCKERRPNNAIELFQILEDAWKTLPVDLLRNLVDSMPRRCAAVLKSNGFATVSSFFFFFLLCIVD